MDHQSPSTENSLSSIDSEVSVSLFSVDDEMTNSLSSVASEVSASLSSVDSAVTASLELIFPAAVGDRIKRCISLYKTRHMSNRYDPVVMTQWCVERFLDNDPALDNNDAVADVGRHEDKILDDGGDISITLYEPSKDIMVTGFSSGDEKTVDECVDVKITTTEDLQSAVEDEMSCKHCGFRFTDAEDRKRHYRSDWHRYNLRKILDGQDTVSEDMFENMSGDRQAETTFSYTIENIRKMNKPVLSPKCMIHNLPWRIVAKKTNQKYFGFFLQCNAESSLKTWYCDAEVELRIINQKKDGEDFVRKIQHLFCNKEHDWGCSYFILFKKLLDPNEGFCKDNKVTLQVHVTADKPRGVRQLEAQTRQGSDEDDVYMNVRVVHGSPTIDPLKLEKARNISVMKLTTLKEFVKILADFLKCSIQQIRSWPFLERQNKNKQATLLDLQEDLHKTVKELAGKGTWTVFVETLGPDSTEKRLAQFNKEPSSPESLKSGIKSLASDRSIVLNKISDSNCTSVGDKSDLKEGTKQTSDINNTKDLKSPSHELTSDINNTKDPISPVTTSDKSLPTPSYLKSVSTSFDISRNDTYSSTILDSSSEDSRDSVISQGSFSEEDLPIIPLPKKANTSIGSLFSMPHSSTTASSSQSSFSVKVTNSSMSAMKRPSWTSNAGNNYLNSKSTITRPHGSAPNSPSSAKSSLSSAYSFSGSTHRPLDPAHSSPSSAHRPTGSAYCSPGSAHRSTDPALSSPSSAHRPTGSAYSSPSSAHRSTGPAHSSPSPAHRPLGSAYSSPSSAHRSTGPAHTSPSSAHRSTGAALTFPSSAHRPFGSDNSSPSSAHRSTGPALSSPSSAHSSPSSAHKSTGSAYSSASPAHNSHGSAHRPLGSAYNSTTSAHRHTGPAHSSPSSAHIPFGSAYNYNGSAHRPTGSAHSSTFKLSPSKFNSTKSPGKAVPCSTFQPKTVTSTCTTPEFSSITTSPMTTHSRLSSLNSSNRTEQTITIQSTHHITCSSSKNSASSTSHENIPVVTEITTPGPKISVKLNRLTAETIGEYQPDRSMEDKMKHDDNRFNIGCQLKCGHCSKCKDDIVMKEASLLQRSDKNISNHNNNDVLAHTIPTYVNAADKYFKDVYDDTKGHDAGFPDSSKSTDTDFKEDQAYFVTNRYGKREAMLYKNGGLIPYGPCNGTKSDIHGFIEGHTYKIACEGQKAREMVWFKGKLQYRREMIQRYHAERRQEQENETQRMLDVLARSRQKLAALEPTVPLVNFETWRERRESLYAARDKEQDPNHLNPIQNSTEKSSVSKTNHESLEDGANSLENDDDLLNDDDMNDDNILDLTEDITEITNNDNNTVNEIQPVEVIDDEKRVKNEVLELFPDVDLFYLGDLCSQHTGPMAVNNICLALLDSKYPKSAASAAKTDSSSSVEKKQYIDYYTHPPFNVQSSEYSFEYANYQRQAFHKLSSEFRWIPANEIRFVLNQRKCYALAHRELSNIWKIPTEAVKNASPSSRGILKGFTFTYNSETKSGQKVGREMKLLKNRRPAIVSSTLGLAPKLKEEIAFVEQKIQESAVEEDYKVACYMNEQEYETEGQCIECGCCYMEWPFESMVQCYEGHLFCETCLRGYAREAIFGQGKADLKCMTDLCDSSFPHSQLEKALPSDILVKYEDRCTEESLNLAGLGDLVKCPFCDFRACLDSASRVFMCQNPDCKKESCRHCQADWEEHFGKKCSEVEKKDETKLRVEYEEKMTKAKVRVCHRCKAQFTKEDGCNKMTCRCGAKQCYICRKPDIDYNHFCRHPRDPGKLCTNCISCSLWTNPDEDDNRAIAELQKAGEEEKRLKGFTSDTVIGVPDEPPVKKQKVDNQ